MKRAKVCLVMGSHWYARMGGAQYQARCLVEELIKDGRYDVTYIARVVDPAFRPVGYDIVPVGQRALKGAAGFLPDISDLYERLTEIDPTIIYQRGLNAYTGVVAKYAVRRGASAIFHIAHDYDVTPFRLTRINSVRSVFGFVEKKLGDYGIRTVDKIIAQTQRQANLLNLNYQRNVTAIVPNFHPDVEEPIVKNNRMKKVVWVANMKDLKRPEIFVKLANDLKGHKDVKFIMVGRTGGRKKYRTLAEQLNGLQNLEYKGELPIEAVNRELVSAHLFVNTSVAEGFPNTFIQAWLRKVPVISLSVDIDAGLKNEGIGFCAGDYESMRQKVASLVEDAETRRAMGERARAYALQHHSLNNAKRLVNLFVDK